MIYDIICIGKRSKEFKTTTKPPKLVPSGVSIPFWRGRLIPQAGCHQFLLSNHLGQFFAKNTRGYETSRSWCISSGLLNEKQGAGSKPNPYILITYYL